MAYPPPPERRFRTPGFANYACAYSPFFPTKLAVASASNFGLVGNGRLHVLDTGAGEAGIGGGIEKAFDSQDGLYDLAWSEVNENQLATGSGDGSIKLWDIMLNWTPERPTSIMTIPAHTACVYSAHFSPSSPNTLASTSSDGMLKIWDTSQPTNSTPLVIPAHSNTEVLSLDWNKYASWIVVTGGVDRTVRIHDIRMGSNSPGNPRQCLVGTLLGHEYAVRRVACSPHSATQVASASYDMTARVWSLDPGMVEQGNAPATRGQVGMGRCGRVHDTHSEFVVGLGWSLYNPGEVASASWDQEVHVWGA